MSKFKESEGLYVGPKEAGYCLLRSQLLMAFHDNPSFRHLANQVPAMAFACMSCHWYKQVGKLSLGSKSACLVCLLKGLSCHVHVSR